MTPTTIKNQPIKIGLIQLNSKLNPLENIDLIRGLIPKIKSEAVQILFLPEYFYSLGNNYNTNHLVEIGNQHFKNIKLLAMQCGTYFLGGTAATKTTDVNESNERNEKIVNRTYNFSPTGELLPFYDKINLFKCTLDNNNSDINKNTTMSYDESKTYTAGKSPLTLELTDIQNLKIGFGICFDLRFPELFRNYVKNEGVHLLSISAAFTATTGKAHWHTLLRARAIENQAYVIAAAQVGTHDGGISTYGHSLIIDPWGEILVDSGGNEKDIGLWCTNIDINYLENIRNKMKVF